MDEFERLVLSNLDELKKEFRAYSASQAIEISEIKKDVNQLKIDSALNKQRIGAFSAGIAAIVSLFSAYISQLFSR